MPHANTISLLQSTSALDGSDADDNLQSFCEKRLSAWILTDGKAGDVVPCLGLAQALGLSAEQKIVAPRKLFGLLAPFGPIDWKDRWRNLHSRFRPPWPGIAIASGRRAVPYLRYIKKASQGEVFTVFLKNPRTQNHGADVVWAPAHDGLAGPKIISTLIAPHLATLKCLSQARQTPDPRCLALPAPRLAVFIGGDNRHYRFSSQDVAQLSSIIAQAREAGMSVMITPSRRTPHALKETLWKHWGHDTKVFFWRFEGENPYISMLALADHIIVTADSTNMVGEVLATNAPVQIYEPSGGGARLKFLLEALEKRGAARRWRGALERFDRPPFDETLSIASAIARKYENFATTQKHSIP